jgi:plasmid stability protein
MAVLTVRNIPDQTKEALRVKAAKSGVSLEKYVRRILQKVSNEEVFVLPKIMETAAEYFGEKNGEELELPPRNSNRLLVEFEQ